MQTNSQSLSIVKGEAFSTILEYKEDNKRVFTDYTGFEFKAQVRAAKSSVAKLFTTVVPVAVGLGQLRLSFTDVQTAAFEGTTLYYDILAKPAAGIVEKIFEGSIALTTLVSVTQWENVPPITTCNKANDATFVGASTDIILTANEVGASTYYTTDGSTPDVNSTKYTAPFRLTAGTYTIKFFSVDTAGNVETVKSVTNLVVT